MKSISFGEVVRLLDGPLAPIPCVSVTAYERCSCPDEAHCGLRMLMVDVRNAISRILDQYTLDDIIQITLRKIHRDGVSIPFLESFFPSSSDQKQPEPVVPPEIVTPAAPSIGVAVKRRVKRRASKG